MPVHIIPKNDEQEHSHTQDCSCEPRIEWLHPETGMPYQIGPLVIHNAHDCREVPEKADGLSMAEGKGWGVWTVE